MRRLILLIGLELYALALAALQSLGGVRTDEAKYLLDIPYPHPPFLRWLMHLTESVPHQDILWRVLLASLFIQAAWLVWDLGRDLPNRARLGLAAAWLLSGGVALQAGAVMLAPVNALEGLVFVWLLSRPGFVSRYPLAVALLWAATLFTAYQGVLYLPLAVALYLQSSLKTWEKWLYVLGPFALLCLYTLQNPLAVASITHHGTEDLHSSAVFRIGDTLRLWLIGGSIAGSVAGTVGLLLSRRWELLASFALVFLFIVLNRFEYYAVLFTPLLIAGLAVAFRKKLSARTFLLFLLPCACITLWQNRLHSFSSHAPEVMRAIEAAHAHGEVLINGDFGHEWEYASPAQVRRYRADLLNNAGALVCLEACDTVPAGWKPLQGLPETVFVR
jgi:hypothetical protein